MIKAIIYDLDGTLMDTRIDISNSVNFALEKHHLSPKSVEEITAAVGNGIPKLIQRCLSGEGTDKFDEILKDFKENYGKNCAIHTVLYSGVSDFLTNHQFLKQSVYSNKSEIFCRILLEKHNLLRFIDPVFGGDSSPKKKPDPIGLIQILEHLQIGPEEAVMVGDSAPDVIAGQKAGVCTIGILNGMGNTQNLKDSNPNHLIDHFYELKDLLKKDFRLAL